MTIKLERKLSAKEYAEFKNGNRATKRAIARGPRLRENFALEKKILDRSKKAKVRAKKARRKERKLLRSRISTPIIGGAQ